MHIRFPNDNAEFFLQIIALGFPLCPGNSLFMLKHMSLISACQNPPLTDHVMCDSSSGKKKGRCFTTCK